MARKGEIAQIFSMALHHDRPELYLVGYVDFGKVKEVSLPEFLQLSENFEAIPATRISYIKKEAKTLYSRRKAETGADP